ncbi:cytochrome P450 [Allorhizocola rhizosphaerae]|uniref:cytochrome P450 n=1 Tax=Allorhizocola rhizosphaerae TaxID=1872709 RepID=UPI000E3D4695|nr:cytochrome P450 [Allorhizocola rhizosphaerae]
MPEADSFPFQGSTYLGPDPRFAQWRASQPVVRVATRSGGHAWLVTRYEDVRAAAADPRLSREAAYAPGAAQFDGLFQPPPGMVASLDPPAHTRLRRVADQAFSPARIEAMRPRIRQTADDLLDDWAGKTPPIDLMAQFASPLALTVICELLGAPLDDRERFHGWVRQLAVVDGGQEAAAQAQAQLGEYIAGLVAAKRQRPGDDVLSALAGAGHAGDRLTDQELVVFGWTLLGAGFDSTAGQIGLSVLALLAHYPQQWKRLHAHSEEIPSTVEELLRGVNIHRSDTSGLPRIAMADIEIGGQVIPAGDAVFLAFTSANHDETVFADPRRLDFARDAPNLAFGHGIHHCLGAPLARIELCVALERLTQRFPGLCLAVAEPQLRWRVGDVNHTLLELPVAWPAPLSTATKE